MEKCLASLEAILRTQLGLQQRLGELGAEKLVALKRADYRAVGRLLEAENQQLQALAEAEKERLLRVAQLTQQMAPQAARPARLGDLAQSLPEPWRTRLLGLRAQLREQLERTRRQSQVAHLTSEALLRHMQGLMQSIGMAVTGVAGYNRSGAAPRSALAMRTFEAKA